MTKRTFDEITEYKLCLEDERPPAAQAHILERIKGEVAKATEQFTKTSGICFKVLELEGTNMDDFDQNLVLVEKNCKKLENPEEVRQRALHLVEIMPTLPDDKEILHAHIRQMDALTTQYDEHFQLLAVEQFRKAEAECQRLVEYRIECAAIRETAMEKTRQALNKWN